MRYEEEEVIKIMNCGGGGDGDGGARWRFSNFYHFHLTPFFSHSHDHKNGRILPSSLLRIILFRSFFLFLPPQFLWRPDASANFNCSPVRSFAVWFYELCFCHSGVKKGGREGEGLLPRMVWWIMVVRKGVKGTKQGGKFVIMERDEENEKANEFDGS